MGWKRIALSLSLVGLLVASLGMLAACGGSSAAATPTRDAKSATPTKAINLVIVTAPPTLTMTAPAPAPGAVATPTPAPSAGGDKTVYEVQAGDTLSAIAEKFKVTVDDIVKANNLSDPNKLSVGQKLIIPKPSQ